MPYNISFSFANPLHCVGQSCFFTGGYLFKATISITYNFIISIYIFVVNFFDNIIVSIYAKLQTIGTRLSFLCICSLILCFFSKIISLLPFTKCNLTNPLRHCSHVLVIGQSFQIYRFTATD